MASITIRNLDERTKKNLKIRAAQHGRSMEEEVRQIIKSALQQDRATTQRKETLAEAARSIFGPLGGVELELPPRGYGRDPPTFD